MDRRGFLRALPLGFVGLCAAAYTAPGRALTAWTENREGYRLLTFETDELSAINANLGTITAGKICFDPRRAS